MLTATMAMSHAGAQTPTTEPAAPAPTAVRSSPAYPEPYIPPALRKPLRDYSSGPILLRYQAMQKLKKRFDEADQDGSGMLTRDEARKAGLGFVDKNFEHIDTGQKGKVSFDDLKAYLIQRREEARSR
ncbi:EF-hand domain-containing protein [Pseudoduganella sp. FT55W]|uniref:EF-hand domain-containing protein n=2 Tax=Duganella rivi TaxID=2666083 RepID=A0A7X4GUB5_9BURK|nr:EF-hand domain-containing protein [Duganella rivi]